MCCSQGSEGRSSIGRRLAAVAAGVVATALMLGGHGNGCERPGGGFPRCGVAGG